MFSNSAHLSGSPWDDLWCMIRTMERRTALRSLAAVPLAASAAAGATSGWSNAFAERLRDDFLVHWRSTKDYTLAVLEAMPAREFGFQPAAGQFTFAEQLEHIGLANNAYFSSFATDVKRENVEGPPPRSQAALRRYLNASFDYGTEVLGALTEEDFSRRDISFVPSTHTAQDLFLRGYMHSAHHRGQLVVYLRLKGITPPPWVFSPTGIE